MVVIYVLWHIAICALKYFRNMTVGSFLTYFLVTGLMRSLRTWKPKWIMITFRDFGSSSCLLAFTIYKAILKYKKRSGTSLPVSFCAWFSKKNICQVILTCIAWLPLLIEILDIMRIVITCCPACDVRFLIKPFSYMTKKSGNQCKYLKNEKSV